MFFTLKEHNILEHLPKIMQPIYIITTKNMTIQKDKETTRSPDVKTLWCITGELFIINMLGFDFMTRSLLKNETRTELIESLAYSDDL